MYNGKIQKMYYTIRGEKITRGMKMVLDERGISMTGCVLLLLVIPTSEMKSVWWNISLSTKDIFPYFYQNTQN